MSLFLVRLQTVKSHLTFFSMGSGVPNLDPHNCMTRMLLTEPSPQPFLNIFYILGAFYRNCGKKLRQSKRANTYMKSTGKNVSIK